MSEIIKGINREPIGNKSFEEQLDIQIAEATVESFDNTFHKVAKPMTRDQWNIAFRKGYLAAMERDLTVYEALTAQPAREASISLDLQITRQQLMVDKTGNSYDKAILETLKAVRESSPINMVLHCPQCHTQHIDAEETEQEYEMRMHISEGANQQAGKRWTNPPHRSHLCSSCGFIWRPADVFTNGVLAIKTKGKNDA